MFGQRKCYTKFSVSCSVISNTPSIVDESISYEKEHHHLTLGHDTKRAAWGVLSITVLDSYIYLLPMALYNANH